jgi:hypothetical protein
LPTLNQLTFAQIQQQMASQYSAVAALPANVGPGSALGAIFNAFALTAVTIEGQIAFVNGISRLLTSAGADIDSFVAAFGIIRNPSLSAFGNVTFNTPSPVSGSAVVIPVGTIIQTSLLLNPPSLTPAPTQFTVIADVTQAGYNAGLNGYVINIGFTTVNATVAAVVPGSSGNVQANQITTIVSTSTNPAPAGVSGVTNPGPFTNGADAETDTALVARFQAFIANRWATDSALASAVTSASPGLTYLIGDQLDAFGNALPSTVTVVVGVLPSPGVSGTPAGTINTVQTALIPARPAGIPINVVGPTMVSVTVVATITLAAGAVAGSVSSAVSTAVQNYINGIGLANGTATTPATAATLTTVCSYSQVINVMAAVPGAKSVSLVTVNGGTSDIQIPFGSQSYAISPTITTQ